MEDKDINSLFEKTDSDAEDIAENTGSEDGITEDTVNGEDDSENVGQEETTSDSTEETKKKLLSVVEYVEIFSFALIAVLFIFSFCFKICVVDGDSMQNTLQNGEKIITVDFGYKPERGDIVVLYDNGELNKPLVKRVIATEGQTVEIDHTTGVVKVDGEVIEEDYVYYIGGEYHNFALYERDKDAETLTVTVPEGQVFVMGDNRNNSLDSRSKIVGCITESQIFGKVILRLSPFETFN